MRLTPSPQAVAAAERASLCRTSAQRWGRLWSTTVYLRLLSGCVEHTSLLPVLPVLDFSSFTSPGFIVLASVLARKASMRKFARVPMRKFARVPSDGAASSSYIPGLQVLEDNAYERRSHAQSAGEAMEVERPGDARPAAQLEQAPAHTAAHAAKPGPERTAAARAGPAAPDAHIPEASGQPATAAYFADDACMPANDFGEM